MKGNVSPQHGLRRNRGQNGIIPPIGAGKPLGVGAACEVHARGPNMPREKKSYSWDETSRKILSYDALVGELIINFRRSLNTLDEPAQSSEVKIGDK
jgi:hypothetical protein